MYEDKTLVCKDCNNEFVFSAGEQAFYAEKGFMNEPTRCRACRNARKATRGTTGSTREMFDAVCADCGRETKVPFQPTEGRAVYCSELSKRIICNINLQYSNLWLQHQHPISELSQARLPRR